MMPMVSPVQMCRRRKISHSEGGAGHRLVMLRISLVLVLLPWGKHQQHVAEASSRSVESAYDTNKGVFSPQGRLVQLDYVEVRLALWAWCEVNETAARVQLLVDRHTLDTHGHLVYTIDTCCCSTTSTAVLLFVAFT